MSAPDYRRVRSAVARDVRRVLDEWWTDDAREMPYTRALILAAIRQIRATPLPRRPLPKRGGK